MSGAGGTHLDAPPRSARSGGFLAPYLVILAIPGAWRFSLAGIIGRMPMSMYGLGTVLLISAGSGRYGLAGSVSASGALGLALCGPQLARLADRVGQRRVLIAVCLTFVLAVAGLSAAVTLRAPDWTLFACAVTGGAAMPQTGPMARARWSVLLAGSSRLHTAFSVESVADELCFVIGPAAVTLLATQVHPAAGIGCAALFALAGSLWFAAQRSTEPPAAPARTPVAGTPVAGTAAARASPAHAAPARWGRPRLAAPALEVLLPVYVFTGAMFVTVDLSTVDFAARLGYKPLSGLVLGCLAFGSAVGGLWYGSRNWRAPVWRRMAVTLCLAVAGVCTLWAMPDLLVLTLVISLCGLMFAPTLISGYSLLQSSARPGRATEAMSWLSAGISVGVAGGATAAGFILDAFGPRWGYAFAAACGVVAALVYLAGLRRVAAGQQAAAAPAARPLPDAGPSPERPAPEPPG